MVNNVIKMLIITGVFLPLGIFLGCGVVYVFNRLPARWLCDYGEEPAEELLDMSIQRIKGFPNKLMFSFLFATLGIFFGIKDYVYAAATLLELWLLLMIAISDQKYMIIPDQFVIFLALFAFPMSIYRKSVLDMLLGLCLGSGVMLAAALAAVAVHRAVELVDAFASRLLVQAVDVLRDDGLELMGAIGLTAGLGGTAFILAASSLMSCCAFAYKLAAKKMKKSDALPLAPYIAVAAAIYMFINGAMM